MEQRVTRNDHILGGEPVVAGTRLTVACILERLGAGETIEELLEAHPRLTRKGVQAALLYAAGALRAALGSREPAR